MALPFVARFTDDMKTALRLRRQRNAPEIAKNLVTLVLLVGVYIAISILVVPPGEADDFNFADERGSVTALSAIFLAVASAYAFICFLVTTEVEKRHRLFWLMMTCVFGFLALDELLQFHERVGSLLEFSDTLKETIEDSSMRNWNDVIVILYGVMAIPVAIFFLPSVFRFPRVFELLFVGCCFYVVHTAIDSAVEPRTTFSTIVEESNKLYCSMFLAVAMFVGLLGEIERKAAAR